MRCFSVDLWEGFNYMGEDSPYRPSLDAYILKSGEERPAVLILPGSGYVQCSPREAEAVAVRFNAAGFHSFVLWYSCAPRRHPLPLLDCGRALSFIRENAAEWKLDPGRVALMGFSAGGHLALSGALFHGKDFAAAPGIKPGTTRPDALILCYPVISSGAAAHRGSFNALLGENPDTALLELLSLEKEIDRSVALGGGSGAGGGSLPPVFLWHTWADESVPVENSLLLAGALKKAGAELEMHIFPKGKHGLSLANHETSDGESENINLHAAQWFNLCLAWLKEKFSVK